MHCYHCQGIEQFFNQKLADGDLNQYRQKGPAKTTRLLVDALKAEGADGMTLLDIGGGIGVIQHELLRAGVTNSVAVEASTAYIEAARKEAERQGHAGRVYYYHGDFVALAPTIAPADIVTLDRVICCYPDMPALVELSAARAGKLYGVVYPRDRWWMRIAQFLINLYPRMQRNPFRFFVHPTAAVDAAVRAQGLSQRFYRKTLVWQIVVYGR